MLDAIEEPLAKAASQSAFADPGLMVPLLMRLLDEIDYGLILLAPGGRIQHANHLARHELATGQVIRNAHGLLVAVRSGETAQLRSLATRAMAGHRGMVEVGEPSRSVTLAFVPLGSPFESDAPSVLVLFGKRQVCESLTMRFFARSCGLSPTEESVLKALCEGKAVDDIARVHGVAESTVRTQVRVLRAKTRSNSIRELIRKVSTLPPLVPSIHGAG